MEKKKHKKNNNNGKKQVCLYVWSYGIDACQLYQINLSSFNMSFCCDEYQVESSLVNPSNFCQRALGETKAACLTSTKKCCQIVW